MCKILTHYRKFNQLYKYLVKSIELAVDGFDLEIYIYMYINGFLENKSIQAHA